ncbi:MAG: FAD-binding oxidoreductase [Alphaproteobacteria bacterium]|nr:MAG: FAD-binding oxidoreductase [Alphaproteobacteria bacterium]
MSQKPSEHLLAALEKIVGPKGALRPGPDQAPYLKEWRDKFQGATPLILRPASTLELSEILKLTYEADVAVVPQGGNTGLVGGQIPHPGGDEILISLDRMTHIRAVDTDNNTLTVDGGVILAEVQKVATDHNRFFPLSLASEGSARIGGLLSTNAGGTNVLRYGNAREQVLGLEVVLPDGTIWEGLRGLRKDNTGYDLKDLFIGAEGTLGIITGAVLKLQARPRDHAAALVGLRSPADAIALLAQARAAFDQALTGFELMSRRGLEFVIASFDDARDPLAAPHDWYVLLELSSTDQPGTLSPRLERFLADVLQEGLIADAALAASDQQRRDFWDLRERFSEAQKPFGGSIKHDISLPASKIAEFLERANDLVAKACPGIRPVPFGHLGDGNLHYNLTQPEDMDKQAYLDQWPQISRIVHDLVSEMGGSISAEHGLGQLKRDEIKRYKSEIEMDLMRRIKQAFDPKGLMNPGKVV